MTTATGVWIYPDAPIDDLVAAVVAADRSGIDEVWIADEGVMRDPFVVFAAAAGSTERVRMGIGITSPLLRHPGAIAATAASLDELSGGRLMLGLGVGGRHALEPFSLAVERPVATLRDALRTARAVLERRDADGYVVTDHAAPARDVPLYVASRGEQINRLASREADGVFLSGFPPDRLDEVLGWVRSEGSPRVALYQSVRFRTSPHDDATAISGDPRHVADVLDSLVDAYAPHSIGLALVDGASPATMVRDAVEVFDLLNNRE
jgi:alkanesulfonate monooxygenase SsuD/methylene tetrahydromethanopterin reductase-like flavin-dependent oxidoreductase (luciferase family)